MKDPSGEFGFVFHTRDFWSDNEERRKQRELNTKMLEDVMDDDINPYVLLSFAITLFCVLMILATIFLL